MARLCARHHAGIAFLLYDHATLLRACARTIGLAAEKVLAQDCPQFLFLLLELLSALGGGHGAIILELRIIGHAVHVQEHAHACAVIGDRAELVRAWVAQLEQVAQAEVDVVIDAVIEAVRATELHVQRTALHLHHGYMYRTIVDLDAVLQVCEAYVSQSLAQFIGIHEGGDELVLAQVIGDREQLRMALDAAVVHGEVEGTHEAIPIQLHRWRERRAEVDVGTHATAEVLLPDEGLSEILELREELLHIDVLDGGFDRERVRA